MSSDLEEPLGFLNSYYQAFSALEVDAILAFYHEPSMFVSVQGVNVVPTHAALGAMVLNPIREDLRSRGFDRSEFSLREGRRLSDALAVLTGVAIRYKIDGSELERVGVTYVLRKQNPRWKIVVLTVHEPG